MNILFLIPLFPLISFFALQIPIRKYSTKYITIIGIGGVGLSLCTNIFIGNEFYYHLKDNESYFYKQHLWTWMKINDFHINMTLFLDVLSIILIFMILGIGFLITIYSSWYMKKHANYSLFFSYINLFISNMILLILADNLFTMYCFWELVGFCSYLLINFYYKIQKNRKLAMKSFIITRISDIFLLLAVLTLYNQLKTINFHEISYLLKNTKNLPNIDTATYMLLMGAMGKSAQFPWHTWLTHAMVGPTPVSALIHSATMVTSGIYLIYRTHTIFLCAPKILHILSMLSIITIILAGTSALAQKNIKKILAYSTISQLGYIFLSLSIQAWSTAIFHLITHSLFKSLLFLSTGALTTSCHHQQNIYKMGGLKQPLYFIYICFITGGASLIGIPWISIGFYSKKQLISSILNYNNYYIIFAAILGTFFTIMYTLRMIFTIFHGKNKIIPKKSYNITCNIPLIILLISSTFLGAIVIQPLIKLLQKNSYNIIYTNNIITQSIISEITIIIGIYLSIKFWIKQKHLFANHKKIKKFKYCILSFLHDGWKIDKIYHIIFVNTYNILCKTLSKDPLGKKLYYIIYKIFHYITLVGENIENNQKIYRQYILFMGINTILIITIITLIS
ncbi:MAG: NADH:quinone oxidoreductase subunit L [Candidatus Westeberhardia cardiocondylae]|nr:NADH:quinone oxidoreductase subunit L [Candidatus Westeberhardia cardiocondylae]